MMDLETLSPRSNAAMLAIGAVKFDPTTGELGQEFYAMIDIEHMLGVPHVASLFHVDMNTLKWWMGQSEEARKCFHGKAKIDEVLVEFGRFCIDMPNSTANDYVEVQERIKGVRMWGNGADFDNVILNHAYNVAERLAPWKFWNNRCYRTIKSLYPQLKLERIGTHHNALDDAKSQAAHLCKLWKVLDLDRAERLAVER
jgi:exodeoxyribonuclease VIII